MNATWRQVSAPRPTVLSYDIPVSFSPSSGMWFHSLHATSHALHPMHTVVSVKNPTRAGASPYPVSAARSWVGVSTRSRWMVISQLPSRLLSDPGAPSILLDECQPRGARGRRPGADVAGERLDLLDVYVRIERRGARARWPRRPSSSRSGPSGTAGRAGGPGGHALAGVGIRSVTMTRASIAPRAVTIVAHPRCSSPRSAASSGDTSQNISGCSSERYGNHRLMPPAVWCSVRR